MSDNPIIGVVATNQARKDWALAAAIADRLRVTYPEVRWWWHTDVLVRDWSIPALLDDYHLADLVTVTVSQFTDEGLAEHYRQCALTLAIGAGEGFGLPIIESLACGIPVLHGDYAGGASILRSCGLADWLIAPVTYRVEGVHNVLRPVHDPDAWAEAIQWFLTPDIPSIDVSTFVSHLEWEHLKHPWRRWFRDGLGIAREDISE